MNELNHFEEVSKTLPKEIRNKNIDILNIPTISKKEPIAKKKKRYHITSLAKAEKDLDEIEKLNNILSKANLNVWI